jgi:elongation factor Ts
MVMAEISAAKVKELREQTGAGFMDCKRALEETGGDVERAVVILRERGLAAAARKSGREAREGLIDSYIHTGGRVGVLIEVNCETDFVARTDDFKNLVRALAEHIAAAAPIAIDKDQVPQEKVEQERRIFVEQVRQSGKPENLIEKIVEGKIQAYYKDVCLLHQAWVRDPKKTIGDLVKEISGKTGENVQVRRFARFQMGEA